MSRARFAIAGTIAVLTAAALPGAAAATAAPAAAVPHAQAVRASLANCPDVTNRLVSRGSTGEYVREVQCLLNYAVHPDTAGWITIDGNFGPATEAKARKFQSCANTYLGAGLVVDGKVGPKTAGWLEYVVGDGHYVC